MRSAILGLTLLAGCLTAPLARAEEPPPSCEVPAYLLTSESKLSHVAEAIKSSSPLNVLVVGSQGPVVRVMPYTAIYQPAF